MAFLFNSSKFNTMSMSGSFYDAGSDSDEQMRKLLQIKKRLNANLVESGG